MRAQKKRLWCRNCNEKTYHELIGMRHHVKGSRDRISLQTLIQHWKREPVYACKICRCRRGDKERRNGV